MVPWNRYWKHCNVIEPCENFQQRKWEKIWSDKEKWMLKKLKFQKTRDILSWHKEIKEQYNSPSKHRQRQSWKIQNKTTRTSVRPLVKQYIWIVVSGGLTNCPITFPDMRNVKDFFGPDLEILKGKQLGKQHHKSPTGALSHETQICHFRCGSYEY